jgi:hypothetical protein
MTKRLFQSVALLAAGAAVGAILAIELRAQPVAAPAAAAPAVDLKAIEADVVRLKALVPSNSHIMMDVQWHWTNLWFAAQAKNWPLAQYQFNETRGHIQWLTRKAPTMKSAGPDKEEVNIEGIFEAIDTSSLAEVKAAIAAKDAARFATAYRTMEESCYSCHKSVGRPYLKPQIPNAQVQSVLNMNPDATWPQ